MIRPRIPKLFDASHLILRALAIGLCLSPARADWLDQRHQDWDNYKAYRERTDRAELVSVGPNRAIRLRKKGTEVVLVTGAKYRIQDVHGNVYDAVFTGTGASPGPRGAPPGDAIIVFNRIMILSNASGELVDGSLTGAAANERVGDIVDIERSPAP